MHYFNQFKHLNFCYKTMFPFLSFVKNKSVISFFKNAFNNIILCLKHSFLTFKIKLYLSFILNKSFFASNCFQFQFFIFYNSIFICFCNCISISFNIIKLKSCNCYNFTFFPWIANDVYFSFSSHEIYEKALVFPAIIMIKCIIFFNKSNEFWIRFYI